LAVPPWFLHSTTNKKLFEQVLFSAKHREKLMRLRKSNLVFLLIAFCFAGSACAASSHVRESHAPGSIAVDGNGITYYAAQGDTLISIALAQTNDRNNWAELGKLNHIGNDRRIPIGTAIVIPANMLPDDPSEASVSAFSGQVNLTTPTGATQQAAIGVKINEGGQVATGNNSFVTFVLSDGSHISLPSNSRVKLSVLRMARFTKAPRTEVTLLDGDVESRVTPLDSNKGRYEVHSALATAGVRGTHFRVAVVDKAIASEVLSGVVAVGSIAKPATLDLAAGTGNVIDATGVGKAVPLLPAPTLSVDGALQERPTIQFTLNPVNGALSYRAQIATDRDAQNVLAETRSKNTAVKVDGLPDGDYFLRVTAFDAQGLEGLQNVIPFKLKARPVPPFSSQPQKKARGDTVDFSWIEAPDAQYYHLQVAKDAAFHDLQVDEKQVSGLHFGSGTMTPGKYYWRAASVSEHDGKIDQGPFGDVQQFELFPPQKEASMVDNGGHEISFNWPNEPGQKFLLQIASDATFKSIYLSKQTDQAEIRIERPDVGTYYVRVQATDPDGYVGAFSAAQKFTIYSRWTTGSGGDLKIDGGTARAGF
jgi:hypothetical protein